MTKEELENLKSECDRLFPINKKLAWCFAIGTALMAGASCMFAKNAYNDMLVKGDIESFEKTHEALENMIPKPNFDVHLD
jgi:hypothetical protein